MQQPGGNSGVVHAEFGQMPATAIGCSIYGSPVLRLTPACFSDANS
jgi:hypothetical protein